MTLLLGLLLLTFCGVAVAAAAWGYALPRSQAMARMREIGTYGFGRGEVFDGQRERRASPILGIASGIGQRLNALGFVRRYEGWMRSRLIAAAMYGMASRTVVGLQLLAGLFVGGLVAFAGMAPSTIGNVALTLFAAAVAWATPLVYVHGKAQRRLDQIDRQTPDLIDMLVVTLEAGLAFGGSMDAASSRMPAPIGDELKLTMQEQRMGLAMTDALVNTLARVETPNMSSFVRSVVQGQNLGVSMGVVMRNLAADMRVRRRQAAEERAHKAPVKMLFPLIFFMFPALGVVILGPALFEIGDKLGGVAGP